MKSQLKAPILASATSEPWSSAGTCGGLLCLEAGGGDGGPGDAAVAELSPDTDGVLLVCQVNPLVVVEGLDVAAGPSEVLTSENLFITSTTLPTLAGSLLITYYYSDM